MTNLCNPNPSGPCSEAEGQNTMASGTASHGEGDSTSTAGFAGAHIIEQFGSAEELFSWFIANGTSVSATRLMNGEELSNTR